MPCKALHDSVLLPHKPSFLLFSNFTPIALVSLLFFKHPTRFPTFGSLHRLSLSLENFLPGHPHGSPPCFSQVFAQMLSPQRNFGVKSLSHVATPWTVAHQAPLSMEFSRQEYWSGLPFLPPGDLPTQGSDPGLPHCRQILYCLNHQGSLTHFIVPLNKYHHLLCYNCI